jgi:hypothetical protein
MVEIRWVDCGGGNLQLQQRTREPIMDAAGAFCGFTKWGPWTAVPIHHGNDLEQSAVHVFDTRTTPYN